MIKSFLYHCLDRANRDLMYDSTIENCHVKGLTSILLCDEPGNRIRMFVAEAHHELWKQDSEYLNKMSLGYHAHHCDLRFYGIFGPAINITVDLIESEKGNLREYKYTSKILTDESKMVATGRNYISNNRIGKNLLHEDVFINADQKHTVWVHQGVQAAWLVFEGKEDPNYISYTYTNNDIFDNSELYRKNNSGWERTLLTLCLLRLDDK